MTTATEHLDMTTLHTNQGYDGVTGMHLVTAWARTFAHGRVRKIACAKVIENGDIDAATDGAIQGIRDLCHRYDTDEAYRNEMNAKFDADAEELRKYMEGEDD